MKSAKCLAVAAVAAAMLTCAGAANAAVTLTGSLSTWESAVGTWGETTTFGALGSPISGFTTVDGVPVAVTETVHAIGSGWATWSGGYNAQVLADYVSQSVTFGLGKPVKGFGVFLEPDPFQIIDISLTTSDGQTLTQAVNGDSGAKFFGWYGPGVTGFTVSSSTDFAIGDVFSAGAVPEPAAWLLMMAGLGGVGLVLRSRRKPSVGIAMA